jgi:GT2 family glycosyltransferase
VSGVLAVGNDNPARVSVILVNWNGRHHLDRCLPALAAQTWPAIDIVVVDNASTDGTTAWLATEWPDVRVLALDTNVGFAEANNRAIRATDAPWVALLNNDTVPEPGWLAALVAVAAGDPRIAAVASRMLFLDVPGMINSAGIAVDRTGIAWDRLGGAPAAEGDAPAAVFGASAGAALFRRVALEDVAEQDADGQVAVFDPRFFMYLEDVDLAWRLRLRGWRSVYAPDACVLHHGSASSGEGSPFKNRLLARNKVWTVIKNYPTWPLAVWWPLILAYDLASAPYRWVFQGQTAALRGRIDALADLGPVLRQRRVIQARRSATWHEIAGTLAPLDPPWAVLRRYRHLTGRRGPTATPGPAPATSDRA